MSVPASLQLRLQQQGEISFAEFMQLALYAPDFGYYNGGLQKLGRSGDFTTAPELTPLFAQTLGNQCLQIMEAVPAAEILEFGAGSGRLCVDLLKYLEGSNSLPLSYAILEVSSNFRHRQEQLIQQEIPHLASRIRWLNQWPAEAFSGIILANEVLDAMPVHRFLQTDGGLRESFIRLNAQEGLVEVFKPSTDERLLNYVAHLQIPTIPYQSEVNLFAKAWLSQCAALLKQGVLLLIDYGFPRHEFYHPDRNQGTIMCHYQHRAHSNPLIHIGEQDITAHVDFTLIAEAGVQSGFEVLGYTSQAAFLLANGLLSLLEEIEPEKERIKATQAAKLLLHPSEMGELFKVMALGKNMDLPLTGFQLQDKRASL